MEDPADSNDAACAATVTRLINQAGAGDPRAAASLLPLVYDRLRALARGRMRQERPDQTLQATALVHEAYLRLVDRDAVQHWDGRWHFYAAAAEAMRRILVEQARRRGRLKRGGAMKRVRPRNGSGAEKRGAEKRGQGRETGSGAVPGSVGGWRAPLTP